MEDHHQLRPLHSVVCRLLVEAAGKGSLALDWWSTSQARGQSPRRDGSDHLMRHKLRYPTASGQGQDYACELDGAPICDNRAGQAEEQRRLVQERIDEAEAESVLAGVDFFGSHSKGS